ncbi:hypothetical protein EXIGLDRAFT_770190 [Exidia glandulosa HHB12029]|uniref:Uncharacterized protein n=1 Tax=Exidia glandulosa HHB12029 TaxID=1314781 RepID=A0A165GX91_EXIGL|nr:hypothetical protein EXIGLDRAFT_770190 [Exidia glandulosa HHB12029]
MSCLRWLTIKQLIAASHVSRDWRAIAISEPSLWTTFYAAPFQDIEGALEAALSRARSAPFDVSWDTHFEMSPRVCALLVEHASHLRSLSFPVRDAPTDLLSILLELSMPHFCVLEAESLDDALQLPNSFRNQPRLRSLTLGEVLLPPRMQAVLSVTSLSLLAPPDCLRLFQFFPRVQDVTLTHVTTATLLPRKLAQSILSLDISHDPSSYWQAQDHSLFLENLEWHLISRMRIESTNILRPVDWFSARTNGEWRMTVTSYSMAEVVNVALEAEDAALHISMHINHVRADTSNWTANLTTLTLEGVKISLGFLARRTFPSLRSFTLRFNTWDAPSNMAMTGYLTTHAFSVPLLQDLNLDFGKCPSYTAVWGLTQLIQGLSVMLSLGERRLGTIHIIGSFLSQLTLTNLSFAKALCDTLRLDDIENNESSVFSRTRRE